MRYAMVALILATSSGIASAQDVHIRNNGDLRQAILAAKPGVRILIEPGEYNGLYAEFLNGTAAKPIVIAAADPANRPKFVKGGILLDRVSYLELRDLTIENVTGNGLNIHDGGVVQTPAHHITFHNLHLIDLPGGNTNGLKLAGVDDFRIEDCVIEKYGGCGIDMVGCHRGVITGSTFRNGGAVGVQGKGATSQIAIRACKFEEAGDRGVNIGGSTGVPFFRPALATMPANGRYEAKDIRVEGCTFRGSNAPIAFVGVDGAAVRFCTIYHPDKWAIRILQETQMDGFVPSRNGIFEDNIVVFRSDHWYEGGVNVGPGVAAQTFRFARNVWYCSDMPDRSEPTLPTPETGAVIGKDPLLRDPAKGDFGVRGGSPAVGVGARAWKKP